MIAGSYINILVHVLIVNKINYAYIISKASISTYFYIVYIEVVVLSRTYARKPIIIYINK